LYLVCYCFFLLGFIYLTFITIETNRTCLRRPIYDHNRCCYRRQLRQPTKSWQQSLDLELTVLDRFPTAQGRPNRKNAKQTIWKQMWIMDATLSDKLNLFFNVFYWLPIKSQPKGDWLRTKKQIQNSHPDAKQTGINHEINKIKQCSIERFSRIDLKIAQTFSSLPFSLCVSGCKFGSGLLGKGTFHFGIFNLACCWIRLTVVCFR